MLKDIKTEIEIATYCSDVMERTKDDKVLCCPKDLLDIVRDAGMKTDITTIRSILRDNWGLRSDKNSDYIFHLIGTEGDLFPGKRKGRYFEVSRELVNRILL
jgi:hypothetical protein